MELECYPTAERPPEIVPGRPQRAWMDRFAERHPYRCLPLSMANTTGWEILCPMAFTAEWNGGLMQSDITLTPDRPNPDFHNFVKSHFSHGVLTFHPGYLFETDWLPFPFTMNWMFTRPGKVRFEKNEPFCFITLTQDRQLADFQPVIRGMDRNPELRDQYDTWEKHRSEFNKRIFRLDPEATREAWQRYYFRGEFPEETGEAPKDHVNKRRLKTPRFGG